ncbi:MAG: amidophosphoribosyltransferase [Dethiobacter sp.]|jgi:amidophosphoribosyltransferase|nr:amidophosphoribosyltransferase [Dethiobacter sp.]
MFPGIITTDGDKFREECGVLGIYSPGSDIAQLACFGLYALQHRGQESAGIAVSDGRKVRVEKGMGLVSEVFADQSRLARLEGFMGVGHVRYSTMGSSLLVNAQPLVFRYRNGYLAVAHNGNLVNGHELRFDLEAGGSIFQTTTDSELIAHLVARSGETDVEAAVRQAVPVLKGAYTFILMTEDKLLGLRDPYGIRPLSLGKTANGYVLASETCAFDTVGAEFIRDIEPGELVVIDGSGVKSTRVFPNGKQALCIFEFIYFARPDSNLHGRNVHLVRKQLGKRLAIEQPVEADIVTGVPDSSLSAATGVAEQLGLPYEMGFIKNRYIGRTFIQPSQEVRTLGVKLKLNPVRQIVKGKRVIMVDDSIVRGTTSMRIIEMLRNAGAREVHVRISSPPVTSSCFYGIDTSSAGELIGARLDVESIARTIGADSLGYLSHEGMLDSMGLPQDSFCTACFSGSYPVEISSRGKFLFEENKEDDGRCGGCGVHV